MSTIDSMLIQASATLLKDLYCNYINPKAIQDETQQKKIASLSTWITAILSLLVFFAALNPPEMIIWLNLLAFGALQAVFLWPLVLGLYWSKANAAGALTSMGLGIVSYASLSLLKPDLFGIHPIVPSLSLGLIGFEI